MRLSMTAAACALLALPGCSVSAALHPPACAKSEARTSPTKVDLEPITRSASASVALGGGSWSGPTPEVVLTSGMASELGGRALRGGEAGGYVVRCALDRFALRRDAGLTDTRVLATIYVDLACEAVRASDRVRIWRGELRARAAATGTNVLSTDSGIVQRLADRLVSDASRELASDLAVRALALSSDPSHRIFADEAVEKELAGMDDTTFGPIALAENPAAIPGVIEGMEKLETVPRASAWNAIAMAAGPGDLWLAGDKMHLDDEAIVRFYQYKALARLGTVTSLGELRSAAVGEDEPLVRELVNDSLASGGIGLARTATRGSP